jgi:hypothetical protein
VSADPNTDSLLFFRIVVDHEGHSHAALRNESEWLTFTDMKEDVPAAEVGSDETEAAAIGVVRYLAGLVHHVVLTVVLFPRSLFIRGLRGLLAQQSDDVEQTSCSPPPLLGRALFQRRKPSLHNF